ncbi:MAG: DUF1800 domain-containing protein [Lautropia sp.]
MQHRTRPRDPPPGDPPTALRSPSRRRTAGRLAGLIAFAGAGCAGGGQSALSGGESRGAGPAGLADTVALLDRITWGADPATLRAVRRSGAQAWLHGQLDPTGHDDLPPEARRQIAAMTISQQPLTELAVEMNRRRLDAAAIADDDARMAAQKQWQADMTRLGREAANRFALRALYSSRQLHEQMVWFWLNHFNVHQFKADIRTMIGDYEERAIRPHALGRFADLLKATARHPAMLRYLDNVQNAAGRINENYARELMELHTLGVAGGYTQQDVQELARVLTGAGVRLDEKAPQIRPALQRFHVRDGLYEFNPNRHDFGAKVLLGERIEPGGQVEIDAALTRLARHPATARHVCRKLALFFVSDQPSDALVRRLAARYADRDGSIAAVLATLFESAEFTRSLGGRFKDPVHYVMSSLRLAYPDKVILNATPIQSWLNRLGQPLYGRQTPDGYPLDEASWTSSGQMTTRFEIARIIGSGSAGLFRSDDPQPLERPAFPDLRTPLFYDAYQPRLGPATVAALDQAASPQEWNLLLLSSPEMMRR